MCFNFSKYNISLQLRRLLLEQKFNRRGLIDDLHIIILGLMIGMKNIEHKQNLGELWNRLYA